MSGTPDRVFPEGIPCIFTKSMGGHNSWTLLVKSTRVEEWIFFFLNTVLLWRLKLYYGLFLTKGYLYKELWLATVFTKIKVFWRDLGATIRDEGAVEPAESSVLSPAWTSDFQLVINISQIEGWMYNTLEIQLSTGLYNQFEVVFLVEFKSRIPVNEKTR